ncbi:MAG: FecR family protein [Methylobacter sp.]|jgi:transmembrane sensor|nr:FecR family protein [Methylobacter sp.]
MSMNDSVSKTRECLEQEAVAWHTRLTSGDISEVEQAGFEEWRKQSPAHDLAYSKIENLWQMMEVPVKTDRQRRQKIYRASKPAHYQRWSQGLAVAASLLLLVTLGVYPDYLYAPWADYSTHIGERTSIRLEDGTVAHLNTDTAFDVTWRDNERRVVLLRGEAEFEVARDSNRPFRVQAGNTITEALGTRFIVRYGDTAGTVTLLEGKVRAEQTKKHGTFITLHPGERVAFDAQRLGEASATDVSAAEAWRRGRLVMNFVTLKQVVAEINRYHRGPITLLGDALADKEINVAIDLNNIDAWLDTLKDTLPIRIRRVGSFVFLQS